jgi:hypothetical protein
METWDSGRDRFLQVIEALSELPHHRIAAVGATRRSQLPKAVTERFTLVEPEDQVASYDWERGDQRDSEEIWLSLRCTRLGLWVRPSNDNDLQSGALQILTRMLRQPSSLCLLICLGVVPPHDHDAAVAMRCFQPGQSGWKAHRSAPATCLRMAWRSLSSAAAYRAAMVGSNFANSASNRVSNCASVSVDRSCTLGGTR